MIKICLVLLLKKDEFMFKKKYEKYIDMYIDVNRKRQI